jgi:hypothetical protein
MCSLSNHMEDRIERYLTTLFGIARVRSLSTETLNQYLNAWNGEYSVNGIPHFVIQSELDHRAAV